MARNLPRGILVAFEGIDGAGKTTQAELLAARLERDGFEVVRTKEPTDGPWGRIIRSSASTGRMDPEAELSAFIEDRRQHVAELLMPALQAGKIVIVDRYYFSTVAYQGARGHDPKLLLELNESFAPKPDLLILLHVPTRVGLMRIQQRGDVANLFEAEAELERAAAIFAALQQPRTLRLDGELAIEKLASEILWTLYEGPISDRMTPIPAGPSIDPSRVSDFVAEVERIRRDDAVAVADKAAAVLDILERYRS